ncbi:TRAP transporter fused permease subunit [Bengtsoniella intestinalis]|uniref:TRAP transporter permease n=1 Tax=Bengtsoniella intestinalis TaxID=3073143 RepID=UPI00391F3351
MDKIEALTRKHLVRWIYIILAAVYIYTAGFGMFDDLVQRALLITFCGLALFLENPWKVFGKQNAFTKLLDWVFALTFASTGIYVMVIWKDRILKTGSTPQLDIVMGSILLVTLLIITWKSTGPILVGISAVFVIYALFGPYFPSFIAHRGETWTRLINFMYVSTEGFFGTPAGVAATYIIMFVIFGSFLESFGAGEWFVDMAYALTGRFRGGPAKTAIVASGLMGMISGSPAANVVITGSFTIPLMKKTGYSPYEAGAICSVASTGGMFTPPIMGAAAFIMAEYLAVPYLSIAASAVMPALLFYLSLMLAVDAIAVKNNLVGVPKEQLADVKAIMKDRGFFAIPIIFLVGGITAGWSPMKSAFYAIFLVLAVAAIRKETRPNLKKILTAMERSCKQVSSIVITCATAGVIVGVFSVTGLGAKLSSTLISASGGNVFIAAILAALVTIVLGCGMPPTPVYIILATVIVPPLVEMGVAPISAHMFIFLFSCIGAITPPVAIAAYTAAAIAEAEPNRTGIKAFCFGVVAYIIPFMLLLSPAILLQGSTPEIVRACITAIIGVVAIVGAIEGYAMMFWGKLPRVLLGASALLLMEASLTTDVIGITLIVVAFLLNKLVFKTTRPTPATVK